MREINILFNLIIIFEIAILQDCSNFIMLLLQHSFFILTKAKKKTIISPKV